MDAAECGLHDPDRAGQDDEQRPGLEPVDCQGLLGEQQQPQTDEPDRRGDGPGPLICHAPSSDRRPATNARPARQAATASAETAPTLRMRTGSAVQSTTVEAGPPW